MPNTHILFHEFDYVEPKTIDEAVPLMRLHGEKAKVIAGGTDLLVEMKLERLWPKVLIGIGKIPALRYLREDKGLRIGALTSFRDIERSSTIAARYTALAEAARAVSSVQIKNMGTIGGNLCHGSPAADSAPPLIAFEARLRLLEANSERRVAAEDFFLGPGETVLSPRELLTEIEVPEPPGAIGSAFLKMVRVSADLAKLSVAVVIRREGDVVRDCRIVLGSVAKKPLRARGAETVLKGRAFAHRALEEACLLASQEIQPITDIRSTSWYRREVSRVLVRDAALLAWKRSAANGGMP
jgi:CO/xanthine dehydrogenase FAD-binding subunit